MWASAGARAAMPCARRRRRRGITLKHGTSLPWIDAALAARLYAGAGHLAARLSAWLSCARLRAERSPRRIPTATLLGIDARRDMVRIARGWCWAGPATSWPSASVHRPRPAGTGCLRCWRRHSGPPTTTWAGTCGILIRRPRASRHSSPTAHGTGTAPIDADGFRSTARAVQPIHANCVAWRPCPRGRHRAGLAAPAGCEPTLSRRPLTGGDSARASEAIVTGGEGASLPRPRYRQGHGGRGPPSALDASTPPPPCAPTARCPPAGPSARPNGGTWT